MTCDGKVMSVTEREVGAMSLASGACDLPQMPDDDEFDYVIEATGLGVVWLAMTDRTVHRWVNGVEDDDSLEGPEYAAIYAEDEARREAWYA